MSLDIARDVDTVVTLTSNDSGEATVAGTVTIPAGTTSATVTVSGVADNIVDGDQIATIAASSDRGSASSDVTVTDVDTSTLSIDVDASVAEGGSANGVLTLTTAFVTDQTVTLSTSDAGEATVPTTVTIPAGATSANFNIDGVVDGIDDGDQSVDVTASLSGATVSDSILVTDVDEAVLSITPTTATVAEGSTVDLTVGLSVARDVDTVVTLSSSDAGEASVAGDVTIPAGSTTATITVGGVIDGVVDGDQVVTVTGSSDRGGVTADVTVTDIDTPTGNNNAPEILTLDAAGFDNKAEADEPTTISGTFADPDIGDTHTVTVDFGDGTTVTLQGGDVDQSGDAFAVDHTYDDGGIYVATVTVSDGTDVDVETVQVVVSGTRLSDDGTLQVIGSSRNDRIYIRKFGDDLRVQTRFGSGAWQTVFYDAAEVVSIDAHLCDGNDTFVLQNNLAYPATVSGGAGRDRIYTGAGDDVIVDSGGQNRIATYSGNDVITVGDGNDQISAGWGDDIVNAGGGNDRVFGGFGDDIVRGGAGDDRLYGQFGNNVLVGGDDDDRVYGGLQASVVIGGGGSDRLYAPTLGGLLISGSTDYDGSDEALSAIVNEWSSNQSYATRIANLRSGITTPSGTVRLAAGDTVDADDDRDRLYGNLLADWFFADQDDDDVFASNFEEIDWL